MIRQTGTFRLTIKTRDRSVQFENWATSTESVDEYNQVVIARTVYRAEQLRFEGKDLWWHVESVDTSAQLTGDVKASRDLGFVLSITAPGQRYPK